MLPRSLSDVPHSVRKRRSSPSPKSLSREEDMAIMSYPEADVVRSYALLRAKGKEADILQHSDTVDVLTFKDATRSPCVYAIGPRIGEGQEGHVRVGQDLFSRRCRLVAVKTRNFTTRMSYNDCVGEYSILERLKVGIHFVQMSQVCYIFMRLYRGLDASTIPASWDDIQRQAVACGMVRSVCALHSTGVLHGDIKPSNFIVQDKDGWYVIRLVDMGNSVLAENSTTRARGTPMYQAPERREDNPPVYGEKAELYSLAICQAEVLSKYSYTEYQLSKGRFDPYEHDDLLKCCSNVFVSTEDLAILRTHDEWRYEILRLIYFMYIADVNTRADDKVVSVCVEVLDELEVQAVKKYRKLGIGKKIKDFDVRSLRDMYNIYPRMSPKVSPKVSPKLSPKDSPKGRLSPRETSPRDTTHVSPRDTSQRDTTQVSPRDTTHVSPRNTAKVSSRGDVRVSRSDTI